MAKNASESDFRSSKMEHPCHFVNNKKMARNAIERDFRTSNMAAGGHFVNKISKNIKVAYWSEIARNAIESDFRSSKMAAIFIKNMSN